MRSGYRRTFFVSRILHDVSPSHHPGKSLDRPEHDLRRCAAAIDAILYVGRGVAEQFALHRKFEHRLPQPSSRRRNYD